MLQNINTIINSSAFTYNSRSTDRLIGIYKITSPSGKIYIGQSSNILFRFYIYKRLHCKKQIYLYNSLIKYGFENHKFEIIKICVESELNKWEMYYSILNNSTNREFGLNLRNCGDYSKHSEESKNKMSLSAIGKPKSIEARIKMSIAKKGKPRVGIKHSDEAKIKMSLSRKGRKSVLKGVKLSDEHKKNLSESLKGRKVWNKGLKMSEEFRQKCRVPKSKQSVLKGVKLSDEHKKNLSESLKGRKAWNKGLKMSEFRKKI